MEGYGWTSLRFEKKTEFLEKSSKTVFAIIIVITVFAIIIFITGTFFLYRCKGYFYHTPRASFWFGKPGEISIMIIANTVITTIIANDKSKHSNNNDNSKNTVITMISKHKLHPLCQIMSGGGCWEGMVFHPLWPAWPGHLLPRVLGRGGGSKIG